MSAKRSNNVDRLRHDFMNQWYLRGRLPLPATEMLFVAVTHFRTFGPKLQRQFVAVLVLSKADEEIWTGGWWAN